MKKIIVAIISFAFILIGSQTVFAGNLFNGQPEDCSPTIGIGNFTTGNMQRDSYGCWKNSSVSASAGDTINVAMYYHNSTRSPLTNVRAVVTKSSSGPANSYSFTGTMYSDQGSQTLGTVSLSILGNPQTLTYSSTHLMKGEADVLADRDTLVVKNEGGINIGTAGTAHTDYGTVIFVYKVGNQQTPNICKDPSATNYGKYGDCVYNQNNNYCTITNFNVNDTSIDEGESVTLSWDTRYCNSIFISGIGNVSSSGSRRVTLYSDYTYKISASGTYGSDSDSVTVRVNEKENDKCRITNFDADDTSIDEGDSVKLRWDTEGCDYVNISNVKNGLNESGSYTVSPSYTRTYTLYAYGDGGTDSDSVKIYVDENDNSDYDDEDDDRYATPSVSTYMPTNITENSAKISGYANGNGARINTWLELPCYGKKFGERTNDSYASISSSVYSLQSNTTYNYCAVAQNRTTGKLVRGSIVSFTTSYGQEEPIYVNKNVVTTVATNVTRSSAQLNGYITSSNYYNSNVYFEYGSTVNLGSRTSSKSTNGNANFSEMISGLSANTIYYFRAVSDGSGGVSKGSIEIFKTPGDSVQRVVINQGTTVVGVQSPVELEITNRYESITEGDIVDYTVTYKNIGKTTLKNPMVQVVVPANMTLLNSSRGTYEIDTHTLSVKIDDLRSNEEGVIYLQTRVDSIPLNNAQIVTTAILVYTSTSNTQENAMAYVINIPRFMGMVGENGNVLGGSVFWSGLGSIGFVGWLLIILIVLLIILIVRSYSNKENPHNQTGGQAH